MNLQNITCIYLKRSMSFPKVQVTVHVCNKFLRLLIEQIIDELSSWCVQCTIGENFIRPALIGEDLLRCAIIFRRSLGCFLNAMQMFEFYGFSISMKFHFSEFFII